MMPGARFFFLSHVLLFVLPDGREGRADYNPLRKGRCSPHPPRGPFSGSSGRCSPRSSPNLHAHHVEVVVEGPYRCL